MQYIEKEDFTWLIIRREVQATLRGSGSIALLRIREGVEVRGLHRAGRRTSRGREVGGISADLSATRQKASRTIRELLSKSNLAPPPPRGLLFLRR